MGAPFYSPEYRSVVDKLERVRCNATRQRVMISADEAIALLDVCTSHAELVEVVEWEKSTTI